MSKAVLETLTCVNEVDYDTFVVPITGYYMFDYIPGFGLYIRGDDNFDYFPPSSPYGFISQGSGDVPLMLTFFRDHMIVVGNVRVNTSLKLNEGTRVYTNKTHPVVPSFTIRFLGTVYHDPITSYSYTAGAI